MKKKYYALETGENEAELVIFGDITSWPWLESDVSAYNLQKEINALDVDRINVHINSYGGEVAEALAITNALIRHKAEITTWVDGFACSAATVIFMAGTRRVMSQYSNFLVHPAWSYAVGNAEQLRKEADDLDTITEQSIKAYMTGVTKTREELVDLMAEERFLTPEETLEWGFATEIEDVDGDGSPAQCAGELISRLIHRDTAMERRGVLDEVKAVTEEDWDMLAGKIADRILGERNRRPEGSPAEGEAAGTALDRFLNAIK